MKKNIFLFFTLIFLLIFTYYYQELGQVIQQSKENKQSKLLKGNIAKVESISFKNYSIDPSDPLISQKKFDKFLHQLAYLKIQRRISWDNVDIKERNVIESSFKHKVTFVFKDRKVSYELGDKVQFSHAFYIRVDEAAGESNVFLCFDGSPRMEYYDPQVDDNTRQYSKIRHLFSLPKSFFYQLKLFKEFSFLSWVEFDHKKNQHFLARIDKFETTPPIIPGLIYNKKEFEDFDKRFRSLEAINLLKHKNILSNKVATIKWQGFDKGRLSLYRKYGNREGYFILWKNLPYELSAHSAAIFYYNLQDFWIKRPFGEVLDGATSLTFHLARGGKRESFHIPISKKFSIKALDSKRVVPKIEAFQKLFLLFFGMGHNYQAQRVQLATETMREYFNRIEPLFVHILDKKIAVITLKDEVLIWDQSINVIFHYLVGPNFGLSFALSSFFDYNN